MFAIEITQNPGLRRIGILDTPRTGPFAYDLIDEIEFQWGDQVQAEMAKIPWVPMHFVSPYCVIVDRLSHFVPFYRTYLKNAMATGTHVINNPFWFAADDKFINCSLAIQQGIPIPRTLCLPAQQPPNGFVSEDLQNLVYPLDWHAASDYIGWPAVLKPYDGHGWKDVYVVHNLDELLSVYHASGELVLLWQEYIAYEQYVRCFALGRQHILPVEYDPQQRRYLRVEGFLTPETEALVMQHALTIVKTLGYDMNSVEFAIRDGVPYAIDFMNPVPDFAPGHIGTEAYRWAVEKMALVSGQYALGLSKPHIPLSASLLQGNYTSNP